MILKIVEGVFSKDTFHVAKTAIDLSIFSQLPFFNNYFLKLPQKLKKPVQLVSDDTLFFKLLCCKLYHHIEAPEQKKHLACSSSHHQYHM